MPDDSLSIAEGALAPWAGARSEYFTGLQAGVAELGGFYVRHPVEVAQGQGQEARPLRLGHQAGPCHATGTVSAASAPTRRIFEGIVPWLQRRHGEAESDWSREQIEQYMREVACPDCDGARLKPESLAVTVGGRNIYELCSLSISSRRGGDGEPRAQRPGAHDRRPGLQGSARADAVPARRGARLPVARPLGRHALGRRGAAHPPGQPDRQRAGGRALRPRRALHRPAPARQPAADRHAAAPARPGQHGHRGGARRGDHPRRRLRGRHRARGGGARRHRRPRRPGHRPRRPAHQQGVHHRPVPLRASAPSRCPPAAAPGPARWSPSAAPGSTT